MQYKKHNIYHCLYLDGFSNVHTRYKYTCLDYIGYNNKNTLTSYLLYILVNEIVKMNNR